MLILVGSENKPRASQVSDSSQPRAATQAAVVAACAELAPPRAVFGDRGQQWHAEFPFRLALCLGLESA